MVRVLDVSIEGLSIAFHWYPRVHVEIDGQKSTNISLKTKIIMAPHFVSPHFREGVNVESRMVRGGNHGNTNCNWSEFTWGLHVTIICLQEDRQLVLLRSSIITRLEISHTA